jgi:streptomycin 6-kinase
VELDKERLVSVARDCVRVWNCLPDGQIFFTHSSLLWPVMRAAEKLILKIANPNDDEAKAAEMLEFYDGLGAVKVLKSHENIQLLERVDDDAGCPTLEKMSIAGQDDEATQIICDVIAQLHAVASTKKPPANLIPFRQRSGDMRRHLNEGRVKAGDPQMFQIACEIRDELVAETVDSQMPLHGDIHHFNILRSAQRGWLAIDPKGIMGPRAYEYANLLCNPCLHARLVANPIRMDRQAAIIVERSGLNMNLLIRFTFVHAVQCAAWSLFEPDQGYWLACAQVAANLAKIGLS